MTNHSDQDSSNSAAKPARINCGVDFRNGNNYGAYSAALHVDGESEIIADVLDNPTFIRCCLMAAVRGLEALPESVHNVEVVTPSTWVAEVASDLDALRALKDKDWVDDDGKELVHKDLWARVDKCLTPELEVRWICAKDVGQLPNRATSGDDGASTAEDGESAESTREPDCEISYGAVTVGNSGIGAYHVELAIRGRRDDTLTTKFQTTNWARMHLTACVEALREAQRILRKDGLTIVVNTQNELISNAFNRGWIEDWRQNKWNRREGDRVRNADLWQQLYRIASKNEVEFRYSADSGKSEQLQQRAEETARKDSARVQEDLGFQELEEEAVKEGSLIRIYSDGSANENPGPGGWGAIMEVKERRASRSEGYKHTTNNRMELMGPVVCLELVEKMVAAGKADQDVKVIVVTDSEYVVSSMTRGWAKRWRKKSVEQTGRQQGSQCRPLEANAPRYRPSQEGRLPMGARACPIPTSFRRRESRGRSVGEKGRRTTGRDAARR